MASYDKYGVTAIDLLSRVRGKQLKKVDLWLYPSVRSFKTYCTGTLSALYNDALKVYIQESEKSKGKQTPSFPSGPPYKLALEGFPSAQRAMREIMAGFGIFFLFLM